MTEVMKSKQQQWTVWVGGGEVNDYYLTKREAKELAQEYKDDGYDDVYIEYVNTQETGETND